VADRERDRRIEAQHVLFVGDRARGAERVEDEERRRFSADADADALPHVALLREAVDRRTQA
jgi:hypothetical protein